MSLISMTGFTRANGSLGTYRWVWELKTVNGKGLDIRLRLPAGMDDLDRPVREMMGKFLARGSCYVTLHVHQEGATHSLHVNEEVLAEVVNAMALVESKLDVQKPTLDGILGIRGVMEPIEHEESEEERKALVAAMLADFESAVKDLVEMRKTEGAAMQDVVMQRVDELEDLTRQAEECPARKPEAIREKLRAQIDRIIEADRGLDEDRLYQEAVLIAGKVDIREELDRLNAHCVAVRQLVASGKPVGRKLDFLAQEFNREANTLCSKSNDTSLTAIGLNLKASIEQLREQIQNVE